MAKIIKSRRSGRSTEPAATKRGEWTIRRGASGHTHDVLSGTPLAHDHAGAALARINQALAAAAASGALPETEAERLFDLRRPWPPDRTPPGSA